MDRIQGPTSTERRARLETTTGRRVDHGRDTWHYPEEGEVKINVSSENDGPSAGVGLGLIARDELGRTMQGWSVTREAVMSPVVAEVEAVRVALLLAQQNGWQKVDIQVDIKALAQCLQAKATPVVEATVIAEDIYLLAMMFESCKFSYGHRSRNRASSRLAWMAHRRFLSKSWKADFPLWLLDLAMQDIGSFDPTVHTILR